MRLILGFNLLEFLESFSELSFMNLLFPSGKKLLFEFSGCYFGLKLLFVLDKFLFGGSLKFQFQFLLKERSWFQLSCFNSFYFVLSLLIFKDCSLDFFDFGIYMLFQMIQNLLWICDKGSGQLFGQEGSDFFSINDSLLSSNLALD